jgi:hypothetical protein
MTSALDHVLSGHGSADRYDTPPGDLLPMQLAAANERFQAQVDQIPLLKNRAESAGVTSIEKPEDVVPLLFAHNTYKTYAESWLTDGQWDRMAKWLSTTSTYSVDDADFSGVAGLDEWIHRLEAQGRYVASSSGTTGKPALLSGTSHDLEFSAQGSVHDFTWSTGIEAANDRIFFGLGPRMDIAKNERIRQALVDAFGSKTEESYQLPVPPISTGSVMAMILLRRRIVEGAAAPSEVAEFERLSSERMAGMEAAQEDAIDALIKARAEKLLISGFIPHVFPLALGVRERGYGGDDFADNALFTGGGLKGAQLPADYREVMFETFNLTEGRVNHFSSMQELGTSFPRCGSGRYHVPAWVMVLPLDTPGEVLLETSEGDIQARAAFLDLSLEGRWGGVISGDRVSVDFGRCECGHEGPHFGADIVRFAELEGGDKISCAGTIDAYIRGEA